MKIIHIFAERLFSVKYGSEIHDPNEYERLFEAWQDPEFLEAFFTANESDITDGYYGTFSIEEAMAHVKEQAKKFERKLVDIANNPQSTLDDIFKPLQKTGKDEGDFESTKAYGVRDSWLRVYALKIGGGTYLVTGGAIKLTQKMGERDHTKEELRKIERSRDFLKERGVDCANGVLELSLED